VTVLAQADDPFTDSDILDSWEIPFGLWIEEIVFWLTTNIGDFLDWIKWPVDQLLKLFIDNLLQTWLPWPIVLLLFLALGTATRNVLVGIGSAAALLVCGLLGNEYWDLTMETVGMIIVAVIICSVLGIPLGILAGRVDSFWNRLRPILDGMQVIHPFVYLLPIIFLFGVRRTPGVLATLVFALPPIVRLTNLGIRQVPADVVEAARAFGATERRVLREVQLPLARPTIMAGLNQTLLLSLSMVGIVAIIAGGGLGKPILRALNTSDIPTGASAGAGLYFVGVLLDRISQPSDADRRGSLMSRMRHAWSTRTEANPQPLGIPAAARSDVVQNARATSAPPMSSLRRVTAVGGLATGVLAAVGAFMTWSSDAGRVSAYVRLEDRSLPGAHSGLDATGGSWFGIFVLLAALCAIVGAALSLLWPRGRDRFMSSPGAVLAIGITIVGTVAGFLSIAVLGDNHSTGAGVWVALVAGALMMVVALRELLTVEMPDTTKRSVSVREMVGVCAVGLFLVLAGASGSWILDQRSDAAEIARELAANADGPDQGGLAAEVLAEAMAGTRRVTITGLGSDGPKIGYAVLVLTLIGCAAALARRFVPGRRQQLMGYLTLGLGAGITAIGLAWIASLVRLSELQISPGASAFLSACGGMLLAARGFRTIQVDEAKPESRASTLLAASR
jgi:glycine betaine/proline transport system permease protein